MPVILVPVSMKPYEPARGFWDALVRTPSGCLEWRGTTDQKGYGRITRKGVSPAPILVHRFAWWLTYGRWPEGVLRHQVCDNPPCCEVAHLAEGTTADNNRDMWLKGRASPPPRRKWCSKHPDTPENRKPNGPGKSTCRECNRERQRRYLAKLSASSP